MNKEKSSVLVVGFNSRPLVESLHKAGYEVYVVDFFGDLDLFPLVKDYKILTEEVGKNYNLLKQEYGKFLALYAIDMMKENSNIDFLIIGSGLDDASEEREMIQKSIITQHLKAKFVNNATDIIKKARNLEFLHVILKKEGYHAPKTIPFDLFLEKENIFNFPLVLKKRTGAGGVNVYRVDNKQSLDFIVESLKVNKFNANEWLVQEYIEGIPVSCTTISNGAQSNVITVNRQVIGLSCLNSPKEFMYSGNIVPSNLLKSDERQIAEISLYLSKHLGLKGINGFDFVLRNHVPYFMEINPRIPGSINVSESAMSLNLMDLHVKSFDLNQWDGIVNMLNTYVPAQFATKFIFFAPKTISEESIERINNLPNIHDKTIPKKKAFKGEPLCTILNVAVSFNSSFFGALKIVDEIYRIIDG